MVEVSESHSVLSPVLTGVSRACGDLSLPTATAGLEDAPRLFLLAMVLTRVATQGQLPGGGESCLFSKVLYSCCLCLPLPRLLVDFGIK